MASTPPTGRPSAWMRLEIHPILANNYDFQNIPHLAACIERGIPYPPPPQVLEALVYLIQLYTSVEHDHQEFLAQLMKLKDLAVANGKRYILDFKEAACCGEPGEHTSPKICPKCYGKTPPASPSSSLRHEALIRSTASSPETFKITRQRFKDMLGGLEKDDGEEDTIDRTRPPPQPVFTRANDEARNRPAQTEHNTFGFLAGNVHDQTDAVLLPSPDDLPVTRKNVNGGMDPNDAYITPCPTNRHLPPIVHLDEDPPQMPTSWWLADIVRSFFSLFASTTHSEIGPAATHQVAVFSHRRVTELRRAEFMV